MACSVPSENSSLHYISWSHATTAARWAMRCWGNIVKVSLSTPYQGMRGHPGVALRVRHEATALHDPNRMASQLSRRPKAATPQGMFIDRLTLEAESLYDQWVGPLLGTNPTPDAGGPMKQL